MVRDQKEGELREARWDEALARVVERLSGMADVHGPNAVGAIGSAKLSNEAAYLLQKLMRSLVGTNNVDHRGGAAVLADPRGLRHPRRGEGGRPRPGRRRSGRGTAGAGPFIRRAVRRQGAKLVILHPRKIEDTRYPGVYVPYKPGEETACSTA